MSLTLTPDNDLKWDEIIAATKAPGYAEELAKCAKEVSAEEALAEVLADEEWEETRQFLAEEERGGEEAADGSWGWGDEDTPARLASLRHGPVVASLAEAIEAIESEGMLSCDVAEELLNMDVPSFVNAEINAYDVTEETVVGLTRAQLDAAISTTSLRWNFERNMDRDD